MVMDTVDPGEKGAVTVDTEVWEVGEIDPDG